MKNNRAHRNDENVPPASRPQTPLQPLWQGPPPAGVKIVLTPDMLDPGYLNFYPRWASNLALLTNEFLDAIHESKSDRRERMRRLMWEGLQCTTLHYCRIRSDYVGKDEQDYSAIGLGFPDLDYKAQILTIGNMPVLGPYGSSAFRLGCVCSLRPYANLVWRSFW